MAVETTIQLQEIAPSAFCMSNKKEDQIKKRKLQYNGQEYISYQQIRKVYHQFCFQRLNGRLISVNTQATTQEISEGKYYDDQVLLVPDPGNKSDNGTVCRCQASVSWAG